MSNRLGRRVPVSSLPGSLPKTAIHQDTDAKGVAASISIQLNHLDETSLTHDALWRDTYALTGNLRTFYSPASIVSAWRQVVKRRNATSFVLEPEKATLTRIGDLSSWIDVPFTFETTSVPPTSCSGVMSIVPDSCGEWKIWLLKTILEQLNGESNVDELDPYDPANLPKATGNKGPSKFDAVIVGAGQAGLSVAGRLQALGVSYVIIDKNQNVGDNWKSRYKTARLHTTRQYSHLPFNRTFPSHYQTWLTKDDLAQGYQNWTTRYGINIWPLTSLTSGVWDKTEKKWTLQIIRAGQEHTLKCAHVILAIGAGGQIPTMPQYANQELFNGTVVHSVSYNDASAFKGKHGIVVGTANTAHDIAEDMLDAGLTSVTMVQRSPTYVLPCEYYQRIQELLYNDDFSTEYADRMTFSSPLSISRQLALGGMHAAARTEPERFNALEEAGFKLERYGDIIHYIYERMGGHYMDVGASKKIAEGKIKVKADALPVAYTATGLAFGDGEEIPVDLVVFATGFERNMKTTVRQLFGKVADQADDFWGVDAEGELIGAFKPNKHPGLWYHGGTLGHARYYSRFIALSICAMIRSTPISVYGPNGYDL